MNQSPPETSSSQTEGRSGPANTPAAQAVKRRRRGGQIARRLFAVLLILAGLLGTALVFRSTIINRLAPFFLSRAGLQEATFHLRDVNTKHVNIDYAAGLLPMTGGPVQVALAQMEYDFSLRQVLAGKVERLKIGRAELRLPDWESGPAAGAAKTPLQAFSLEQAFQLLGKIKALPVEFLHIENLVLHARVNGQELRSPELLFDYSSTPGGGLLLVQEQVKEGQESPLILRLVLEGKKLQAGLDADVAGVLSWLPRNVQAILPLERGRLQVQALVNHLVKQAGQELRTVRLSAQGTGIGHAASGWQAERLALHLNAESPPASEDLVLTSESRLELQGLKAGSLQLDSGLLPLQGALHFLPDGLQAEWQPEQALQLGGLRLATMGLAGLTASNIAARIQYASGPQHDPAKERGRIVFGPATRLELKQLAAPGLQLDGLHAPLPLEAALLQNRQELRWRPAGPLVIKGLKTGTAAFTPLNARNIDLRLQQSPDASQLQADFLLSEIDASFRLNWQRTGADVANQLVLQTKKPLLLAPDTSPLRLLAKPPAALHAVALEQGTLGAELRMNWGKAPMDARLNLDVRNAAASHSKIKYSGLSLQHSLQLAPQLRSVQAGKLTLAAIEGPVKLKDLLAKVQLLPSGKKGALPALQIEDGSFSVFDGTVQTSQCRYDPNRSSNTCSFSLHNLDLAAILALHQVEGLDVSGRINGEIPVRHGKAGFSVTDGSLTNAGSGVIHYLPSSEALKSSPYSEYVLKALEDYRYQSLAASLSYQPDGTLIAGLQLQGKSPKLETNRLVRLNLQAEQNLLSLLKSLQYSQGLTSELNRRVQERFQPKQAK